MARALEQIKKVIKLENVIVEVSTILSMYVFNFISVFFTIYFGSEGFQQK